MLGLTDAVMTTRNVERLNSQVANVLFSSYLFRVQCSDFESCHFQIVNRSSHKEYEFQINQYIRNGSTSS